MSLKICTTAEDFRNACNAVRAAGGRLGLVPTMGALHEGHLALVAEARRRSSEVAVTIFVNPTQFGANEDFNRYPRDLDADLAKCESAGVGLAFAPVVEELYPRGERTRVHVEGLTRHLCGPFRPGHFEGVATVVTKLFAVSGPSVAVFGQKDYQQLKVIERMTRDLLLPVEIVSHFTVRQRDGLALSSRNRYLGDADRARALALPRALAAALEDYAAGERHAGRLRQKVFTSLKEAGMKIDYVTIAHSEELEPIDDAAELSEPAVLAVAAHVGTTRLIDNVVLGRDSRLETGTGAT
jgi:pantoate--beta-alanine ligase